MSVGLGGAAVPTPAGLELGDAEGSAAADGDEAGDEAGGSTEAGDEAGGNTEAAGVWPTGEAGPPDGLAVEVPLVHDARTMALTTRIIRRRSTVRIVFPLSLDGHLCRATEPSWAAAVLAVRPFVQTPDWMLLGRRSAVVSGR